jgi:DNA-binding transcriptional regulator LsrR (DeoR family)
MSLPIYARIANERPLYHQLDTAQKIRQKSKNIDVTFVGLGHVGIEAPLFVDGFMTEAEVHTHIRADAAGEIADWLFDEYDRRCDG